MSMQHYMKNKKGFLGIMILAIICMGVFAGVSSMDISTGYFTGAQGLSFGFGGVNRNNEWWSSVETGTSPYPGTQPSFKEFGGTMFLDIDDAYEGMPQLRGAINQFVNLNEGNPDKIYDIWNVKTGTQSIAGITYDVYKEYQMMRYECNLTLTFWLAGTEWESYGKWADGQVNPDWGGSSIWIRIARNQFTYFQDAEEKAYIAPAAIELYKDSILLPETDLDGNTGWAAYYPQQQGDTMFIYYQRGGGGIDLDESDLLYYQGKALDPAIFRDEWWVKIELDNFSPDQYTTIFGGHIDKFPTVTQSYQFYVYVIGEWTTMFEAGDVPVVTPRLPVVHNDVIGNILQAITDFFGGLIDGGNNDDVFWVTVLIIVCVTLILIFYMYRNNGKLPNFGKALKGGSHSKDGSGGGLPSIAGYQIYDIAIALGLLALVAIPDPTDLLDFSLPIVEPLLSVLWLLFRHGGKKNAN